jgi:hypothetical protein
MSSSRSSDRAQIKRMETVATMEIGWILSEGIKGNIRSSASHSASRWGVNGLARQSVYSYVLLPMTVLEGDVEVG